MGVMWMSAAQISLSVLRGGGPGYTDSPTQRRAGFGIRRQTGCVLTSVSSPVLLSIAKVVTVPSGSLNAYIDLLSVEVTKWRGPVMAFIR